MYYLVFFIGIVLSFSRIKIKQIDYSKMFLLIIILVACFRYGVGKDYFSYKYLFERINHIPIYEYNYGLDNQEVGFRLIQSIFKYFGVSYEILVGVFSFFTLFYMYKLCNKYSINTTLSLFIYYSCFYFVWTFSAYRQGVVIFIGLYYLLSCIENKNVIKFIIVNIFLATIHSSAYLLFILYIILKINIKKNTYVIILTIAIIQSFFPFNIIESIISSIPFLKGINFYLNNDIISWGIDFQSLVRIIFSLFVIYIYDSYVKLFKNQKKLLDIFLFSMIIYFTFKFRETVAGRLSIFGLIIFCIILSNFISSLLNRNKLFYISFFVLFLFIYMQKNLIDNNRDLYIGSENKIFIPYTNVFNKKEYYFKSRYIELID